MPVKPAIFVLAALAHAQSVDGILQFTNANTTQSVQELATIIRSTADIRQLTIDDSQRTVSVRATPEQIALANWLVPNLDLPPDTKRAATQPQSVGGSGDDLVQVFYMNNATTAQQVQEIATTARSIAEVPRAFVYSPAKALVVRGTPSQLEVVDWLLPKLDLASGTKPSDKPETHRMGGNADDIVRVFYLSGTRTIQELLELSTVIRSIGEIRRAFTSTSAKALALRGTADQIAMAEWLVAQLSPPEGQQASTPEYRMSAADDGENVVHVFTLPTTATVQDFQQRAVEIRTAVNLRRAFTYNSTRAFVVRGTSEQIAQADRLVKETAR